MRAYQIVERELTIADLKEQGIVYAKVPVGEHQMFIDHLKTAHGYVVEDEVEVRQEDMDRFNGEHSHDDDEVRYVLDGWGIFDIRSNEDKWFSIQVEPGDLISIPQGTYHRFKMAPGGFIKAIRLFKDPKGWVPNYRHSRQPAGG